MVELTPEMTALFDELAVKVLVSLRRLYPIEADALFVTFACRVFLDVCNDNRGPTLDTLVSLFNGAVDAPVQISRRVQ